MDAGGCARLASALTAMMLLGGVFATGRAWAAMSVKPADVTTGADLPVPDALRPQVEFWKQVFGVYSEHQAVIHDTEDVRRVYSVLDFRSLRDTGMSEAEAARVEADSIDREKQRIRALLTRLHQAGPHPEGLSEDERKLWELFGDVKEPGALLAAAEEARVRSQRGVRERFAAGVAVSRRYLPEIENIFREEGVPVVVSRLALVESCFNVHAFSKAGAAGVWQFIPATARLFMRVDDVIDERRDPVISARAAARYLRANYQRLGTWPLAISAYNHGPEGMAQAVAALGTTDVVAIVQRYRGPAFRFASRNFYTEFLAALEVDARHRDYFGDLETASPRPTDWVRFSHYLPIDTASRLAGLSVDEFLELNPALSFSVRAKKAYVPKQYPVRVPGGTAPAVKQRLTSLGEGEKFAGQRAFFVFHKVRKGQTLSQIARRYGTTVNLIKATNRLNSARVRIGQALKIPTG